MKLTNGEIFNAREPLAKLLQEKLPVKVSYGLVQLTAKFNDQLQIIEKVRQGLFQTYGEPDKEKHGSLKIDFQSENFPKFAEEIGQLMAQEVEIVLDVVTLPDTLEVEPATLIPLLKFVTVA